LLDANGVWKENLVRKILPPIDANILKLKTPQRNEPDFLAWQQEKLGVFTVRSAYKLGLAISQQEHGWRASSNASAGEKPIWTSIWKSQVPEKVRIFAWRAIHGALATEMSKKRRNMRVTGICQVRGMEMEDTTHMIFHCPHAVNLWKAMREVWSIPPYEHLRCPRGNCL
jgi:hypothetical protein